MAVSLIGRDVENLRKHYDEALQMQGIPAKYQYPFMADSNNQGEPVIDSYSDMVDIHIFFDGQPRARTYKRLGWVVENDDNLPFLVRCSFNLEHMQKDCLFHIGGHHASLPARIFRVTELTTDIQAPDHIVAQVVPAYDKQTVGRTDDEIAKTYNRSNTFLKPSTDYRGDHANPLGEGGGTTKKPLPHPEGMLIKR